jgi:hypothetical protein
VIDSQAQQDLPQQPTPHQPSKAKVGAGLRDATQRILTRLMTEDPISIGDLQSSCTELLPEQTQDILDVCPPGLTPPPPPYPSLLQVLRVMGLVISVRQKRKRQKIQSQSVEADLKLEDPTTLPEANPTGPDSSESHSAGEIYYTMVGHARGPNVPIGILTGLSKDMTERNKRHQDTLQRIDTLQVSCRLPAQPHLLISPSLPSAEPPLTDRLFLFLCWLVSQPSCLTSRLSFEGNQKRKPAAHRLSRSLPNSLGPHREQEQGNGLAVARDVFVALSCCVLDTCSLSCNIIIDHSSFPSLPPSSSHHSFPLLRLTQEGKNNHLRFLSKGELRNSKAKGFLGDVQSVKDVQRFC